MITALELAQQLIACPSVTPDDAGAQTIISRFLAHAEFSVEPMRFGNVQNLWARYGSQSPLLIFAGHTDVVPPGDETTWRFPPFTPTIVDGHLYGRGATDMKATLAAMLVAARKFIASQPNFPGSLGFLITSDEEGPAINGTTKVITELQQRGIEIAYCIIGEPSSEYSIADQIRIGRRGSLHGKLIVHGIQGHVAHPHLAKNPIHLCMRALDELTTTVWDEGNEQYPPTSFQISNLHSGTGATNVIPGSLEARFNFRHGTCLSLSELKQRTESILARYPFKYTLTWEVGAQPFLSPAGKLQDSIQTTIYELTGKRPKLSTGGGTSDGRFIVATGAEIIELGTLHATAHHVDEHIAIADLDRLQEIFFVALEKLFR